jgi:D-glycero-alpha-D-manno-heptose-7-phosphate kinase
VLTRRQHDKGEELVKGVSPTIRARAPLRLSFAGGGTDVSPYCEEHGGAVLNATVDRFAYASVSPCQQGFVVRSLDYDCTVSCELDAEFIDDGQLGLAKAVVDRFRRDFGLRNGAEVTLHNDAPPGSGLGSSSAITVALVACLARAQRVPLDSYALAELAFEIERVDAGIPGGRQDQYAATFGGFNFIEFEAGRTIVNPLRISVDTLYELQYRLLMARVGPSRTGDRIISRQMENYVRGSSATVQAMHGLKELASEMKRALLLGQIDLMGELLHQAWQHKRALADGIATPRADEVYALARTAGALGGKMSGAGGGGFMVFLCRDDRTFAVQAALEEAGVETNKVAFSGEGVQTWKT